MTAQIVAVRPTWTTGSTEAVRTGSWRAALPHYLHAPSPCHQACPVHGDIAQWIGLARAGQLRAAWDLLMQRNPFPAIAGRICHHPCEAACNRGAYDESVSICKLERWVGDAALAEGWMPAAPPPPVRERGGHVAVVGAGPAGLSAAYQLRRRGWRVTVHEAQPEPGGVMRYGIPAYRLAREVLDGEIERIRALGVVIRCGSALADAAALAQLQRTHDAVFLALGAGVPKPLAPLPAGRAWWMHGAAWLAQMQAGRVPALGPRLVVVGGGSAAMDVARSARRAGHEVTVLALESRAQMPAQREELREALQEGVFLADGAALQSVQERPDGLALHCHRVRFEPGGEHGRFRLTPFPGSEFVLAADAVISAIGQDPDLPRLGSEFARSGALLACDTDGATGVPGVWAGGDLTSMARFVTEAVAMGARAAAAMHRALLPAGEDDEPSLDEGAAIGLAQIATWYHPPLARAADATRDVASRVADMAEVQLPLSPAAARAEAERCFSCGLCTHCDNCLQLCPDLAIRHVSGANGGGFTGYEVLLDYCKGCGLCVKECPTGSMRMLEEVR